MKIKIDVHEKDYPFLLHLAQNDDACSNLQDYFFSLVYTEMELHPDYRFCPTCDEGVNPVISTLPGKYVANPFSCTKVTTQPTEICPECGANTITLEQHLDTVECCTKWIAHMRGLLAVQQQCPRRKADEPSGKEPAPTVKLTLTKAQKRGRKKAEA